MNKWNTSVLSEQWDHATLFHSTRRKWARRNIFLHLSCFAESLKFVHYQCNSSLNSRHKKMRKTWSETGEKKNCAGRWAWAERFSSYDLIFKGLPLPGSQCSVLQACRTVSGHPSVTHSCFGRTGGSAAWPWRPLSVSTCYNVSPSLVQFHLLSGRLLSVALSSDCHYRRLACLIVNYEQSSTVIIHRWSHTVAIFFSSHQTGI